MTESRFDGVAPKRQNQRQTTYRNAASRLAVGCIGVLTTLTVAIVANAHFASAPSAAAVQTVNASLTASVPDLEKFSQSRATKTARSAERSSARQQGASDDRGDRLGLRVASIDARRIAWQPEGIKSDRLGASRDVMLRLVELSAAEAGVSMRYVTTADTLNSDRFAVDAPSPSRFAGDVAAVQVASLAEAADIANARVENASGETPAEDTSPVAEISPEMVPLPSAPPVMAEQIEGAANAIAEAKSDPDSVAETESLIASLPESVPLPGGRPEHAQAAPAVVERTVEAPARKTAPTSKKKVELAYARPDAGEEQPKTLFGKLFGGGNKSALPGPRSGVAVYDIKAATVYLPDGRKLEAHSGLGHMQDNPRYVDAKNRGPTPPNVYNLVMRESRFHGVEAVRLLPSDGRKKFNRDGLLAHTYMYRGGTSQSNGCVVFKNYNHFLTAFKQGKIKKMIVVPSLSELPTYMAAL